MTIDYYKIMVEENLSLSTLKAMLSARNYVHMICREEDSSRKLTLISNIIYKTVNLLWILMSVLCAMFRQPRKPVFWLALSAIGN